MYLLHRSRIVRCGHRHTDWFASSIASCHTHTQRERERERERERDDCKKMEINLYSRFHIMKHRCYYLHCWFATRTKCENSRSTIGSSAKLTTSTACIRWLRINTCMGAVHPCTNNFDKRITFGMYTIFIYSSWAQLCLYEPPCWAGLLAAGLDRRTQHPRAHRAIFVVWRRRRRKASSKRHASRPKWETRPDTLRHLLVSGDQLVQLR